MSPNVSQNLPNGSTTANRLYSPSKRQRDIRLSFSRSVAARKTCNALTYHVSARSGSARLRDNLGQISAALRGSDLTAYALIAPNCIAQCLLSLFKKARCTIYNTKLIPGTGEPKTDRQECQIIRALV